MRPQWGREFGPEKLHWQDKAGKYCIFRTTSFSLSFGDWVFAKHLLLRDAGGFNDTPRNL